MPDRVLDFLEIGLKEMPNNISEENFHAEVDFRMAGVRDIPEDLDE